MGALAGPPSLRYKLPSFWGGHDHGQRDACEGPRARRWGLESDQMGATRGIARVIKHCVTRRAIKVVRDA